jgi:transcriptional regulator with XRE-family HTH domain
MGAGEYVRRKRLEKGISQRQLSAVSGISNSEISRIEAGRRKSPSPAVLRLLARALDAPYEELLAEAGYLQPEGSAAGGAGAKEGDGRRRPSGDQAARLPEWVYKLPPDLYEFIREESARGWPYMRLARGLSRKDLDPAELEAIVQTWMEAKKRYDKGSGRKD